MGPLRDWLLRQAYRTAYWVLRAYSPLARHPERGVKCLILRGDEVLLVRHTYGRRGSWHVPGGRRRRSESGAQAAAREMGEELGLDGLRWRSLAVLELTSEGRRANVECLAAEVRHDDVRVDRAEIAEARFFAAGELPERLDDAEMRVLGLLALPFGSASGQTSG